MWIPDSAEWRSQLKSYISTWDGRYELKLVDFRLFIDLNSVEIMAHLLGSPTEESYPLMNFLTKDERFEFLEQEKERYRVPTAPIYVAPQQYSQIHYKKVHFVGDTAHLKDLQQFRYRWNWSTRYRNYLTPTVNQDKGRHV